MLGRQDEVDKLVDWAHIYQYELQILTTISPLNKSLPVHFKSCSLGKNKTGEIIIHVNFWLISNAPSRISAPVIKGDALIRHYYGYYTPDDSSH